MNNVDCANCKTFYDKDKTNSCPNCKSTEIIPIEKDLPVIDDPPSMLDSMLDAFDPKRGLNIVSIDPENVPKDMMLILLGKDENKFGVFQERFRIVKRDGDKLILEPYDEKGPLAVREEIVNFVVQLNEEKIKESAVSMVKKALMRKPLKTLKKLQKETKKKKDSKLETRSGCVFFEVGDECVIL